MLRSAMKGQRLVALFLLGVLLFNYPLLALFNRAADVVRHSGALRLHLPRLGAAHRPARAGRRALALARRAPATRGPPCSRAG